MADDGTKTSFRQFEYCSLCKSSHKKRKKHVYSKHHQIVLKNILNKFALKIDAIKKDLFSPTADGDDFERNAKFWCYFCVGEFEKHVILEDCTVVGSGLLHHITSDDHKNNMEKFFWDNLLPKQLKSKYVLSKEDLYIFQRSSLLAVKKWQKAKRIEREKITNEIKETTMKRRTNMVSDQWKSESASIPSSSSVTELPGNRGRGTSLNSSDVEMVLEGKLGLTCIKRNDEDESKGNVHTDAIPPWLQTNTATAPTSKEIGPTMGDYQKHLESERKAKLPTGRVGATFDHTSTTSADWLPSFGRVWSKGRRLQSKLHFEKQWKGKGPVNNHKGQGFKKHTSSHTSSSTTPEKSSSSAGESNFRNKRPSNNGTNQVEQNYFSNNSVPNRAKPYGPERTRNHPQSISHQNINGGAVQEDRKGVTVVPYKRRKKDQSQDGSNVQLIQTPLLSQQK